MRSLILFLNVCLIWLLGGCSQDSGTLKTAPSVECQEQALENQYIAHWHSKAPTKVDEKDIQDFVQKHRNELRFVEPNYAIKISPKPRHQETELNLTLNSSDILRNIGAYPAWNYGYLGQGIVIAVIDSGVDVQNLYLRNRIYVNRGEIPDNGIDDDQNGYVDDVQGWNFTDNTNRVVDEIGHGTSVAGTITARRNNGESLAVAPESRILPIDIISGYTGNEFDAKRGIDYALLMKAKIINNSWSIACSRYLARSFQAYERQDVIFVNSAGNIRQDVFASRLMLGSLTLKNFLNVGSTTLFGDVSNFSGFGRSVNLWAPGEQIPVLTHSNLPNMMSEASGTSISAAVVSGAAAVVWSAYPRSTAEQIVSRLVSRSYRRGSHRIVSIDRALGLWTEPNYPVSPLPDPRSPDTTPAPTQPAPLPDPIIAPGAEDPSRAENPGRSQVPVEPTEPDTEAPVSNFPEPPPGADEEVVEPPRSEDSTEPQPLPPNS